MVTINASSKAPSGQNSFTKEVGLDQGGNKDAEGIAQGLSKDYNTFQKVADKGDGTVLGAKFDDEDAHRAFQKKAVNKLEPLSSEEQHQVLEQLEGLNPRAAEAAREVVDIYDRLRTEGRQPVGGEPHVLHPSTNVSGGFA